MEGKEAGIPESSYHVWLVLPVVGEGAVRTFAARPVHEVPGHTTFRHVTTAARELSSGTLTCTHNNTHLHKTFPVDVAILERERDLALPGGRSREERESLEKETVPRPRF